MSLLMGILGGILLAGGVVVLVGNALDLFPGGDQGTTIAFGVMILVAGGLLVLTAVLGKAASDNSARVGPYRFLCYLVSLAVLVAIAWGWGAGSFILFNPIVLVTTIVYVLVCSSLADRVQEEHDRGVRGESFLRSRHQRALHLLSELIILKGAGILVLTGVVAAVLMVSGDGETAVVSGTTVTLDGALYTLLVVNGGSACVSVLAGALGVRGSNQPEKIRPFLMFAALSCCVYLARVGGMLAEAGVFGLSFEEVVDLLFMGFCLYLAVRVRLQPSPEQLEVVAGDALVQGSDIEE